MKNIILCCSLYFFSMLAYANICPTQPYGYIFRVAAWGDHSSMISQIRCHYYYYRDESQHILLKTTEFYNERDIMKNSAQWSPSGEHYFLCVSRQDDLNDCSFSHR